MHRLPKKSPSYTQSFPKKGAAKVLHSSLSREKVIFVAQSSTAKTDRFYIITSIFCMHKDYELAYSK